MFSELTCPLKIIFQILRRPDQVGANGANVLNLVEEELELKLLLHHVTTILLNYYDYRDMWSDHGCALDHLLLKPKNATRTLPVVSIKIINS